jgi:acylphosphatase
MKHYAITVTGKVQGVYFRDTARRVATKLHLSGFARNEADGSVYIEVEGDEPTLQEFLLWCREGSRNASVDNVRHTEHPPAGHTGFDIR